METGIRSMATVFGENRSAGDEFVERIVSSLDQSFRQEAIFRPF